MKKTFPYSNENVSGLESKMRDHMDDIFNKVLNLPIEHINRYLESKGGGVENPTMKEDIETRVRGLIKDELDPKSKLESILSRDKDLEDGYEDIDTEYAIYNLGDVVCELDITIIRKELTVLNRNDNSLYNRVFDLIKNHSRRDETLLRDNKALLRENEQLSSDNSVLNERIEELEEYVKAVGNSFNNDLEVYSIPSETELDSIESHIKNFSTYAIRVNPPREQKTIARCTVLQPILCEMMDSILVCRGRMSKIISQLNASLEFKKSRGHRYDKNLELLELAYQVGYQIDGVKNVCFTYSSNPNAFVSERHTSLKLHSQVSGKLEELYSVFRIFRTKVSGIRKKDSKVVSITSLEDPKDEVMVKTFKLSTSQSKLPSKGEVDVDLEYSEALP